VERQGQWITLFKYIVPNVASCLHGVTNKGRVLGSVAGSWYIYLKGSERVNCGPALYLSVSTSSMYSQDLDDLAKFFKGKK
jgi:hypothetical protein